MQRAAALASLGPDGARVPAPVLLSSGWMGGVVPLVAAALAERLGGADRVETAIRYDLADRAGVDSVEFMDRLGVDFEVREVGRATAVVPLTSTRTLTIGEHRTKVARIDTPEQFTLPLTLGARTVTSRIGFNSTASTSVLVALGRVGFFRHARGERWRPVRQRLLYAPGEGGTASLRIEVEGPRGVLSATVTDPGGQARLTAVGALMGLRRVLGADGAPARPGLAFPESHPLPHTLLPALAEAGVQVDVSAPPRRPGGRMSTAKGSARRAALLDAAEATLVGGGHAALSLRAVAEAAGVRLGHLQYYFPTRDSLLEAVLDRLLSSSLDRLTASVPGLGSGRQWSSQPPERLIDLLLAEQNDPDLVRVFAELWALAARDEAARHGRACLLPPVRGPGHRTGPPRSSGPAGR